jgi:hypothetical protein
MFKPKKIDLAVVRCPFCLKPIKMFYNKETDDLFAGCPKCDKTFDGIHMSHDEDSFIDVIDAKDVNRLM